MLAISDFFNLHTLRPFALMRAPFASLVKFSNATWKIAQHNLKRMPKSGQLTRKHFMSPVLMCELLQKIRNHQVHRPNCDTIRSRNLPKALHHKLEEIGCRVSLATSQSVLNYWRNDLEHCLLIFLVSCLLSCRINWRNIKCRVELCGKNKKKIIFPRTQLTFIMMTSCLLESCYSHRYWSLNRFNVPADDYWFT